MRLSTTVTAVLGALVATSSADGFEVLEKCRFKDNNCASWDTLFAPERNHFIYSARDGCRDLRHGDDWNENKVDGLKEMYMDWAK